MKDFIIITLLLVNIFLTILINFFSGGPIPTRSSTVSGGTAASGVITHQITTKDQEIQNIIVRDSGPSGSP